MPRGFDLTPDLLASQGRALRGLARSLLGETHAAEDVVQETWLACLKRPGSYPERISAWLGTVTRHLALRRLRGESRREVRERQAAAPERLEALQQRTLEREEALRAVTKALLALEEPLKTALLLRYYEDRTPSEIAAELDLPLPTIKSRLARGLDRLRARLGHEFEGDEQRRTRALYALAGLRVPGAPIGGPAGAAAPSIPAIALATKLPAAAAALLLTGGFLWWWQRPREESRGLTGTAASSPAGASADGMERDGAEERTPLDLASAGETGAGARRESVAVESPASGAADGSTPEASYLYRITGQLRDSADLPAAGARIFLAPHGFPLNHMETTDESGRFTLEFAGRRPSLDCVFTADFDRGRMLGLRELHLVSGQELVLDVGINPLAAFATPPLERAPAAARTNDGRLVFVDPPPLSACERSVAIVEVRGVDLGLEEYRPLGEVESLQLQGIDSLWASKSIGIGHRDLLFEGGIFALELDISDPESTAYGNIRGVVRDALGNPVPKAHLRWASTGRSQEEHLSGLSALLARRQWAVAGDLEQEWTDENGAFELSGVPAGEVELWAGGGDHGRARTRLTLAENQDFVRNPVLERGDEVTGRVTLPGGDPFAGATVELWNVSPGFLWSDATRTDEKGRFALPNVPAGALELHVYTSGSRAPSVFPVRISGPLFAPTDLGEIVLDAAELESSTLSLTVLDPDGNPLPGAEVRVWQEGTGRGFLAGEPDETGKHVLPGMPRGTYRVEVGGPFGWHDLGAVWVDGLMELPPYRFASAGVVQLEGVADGSVLTAGVWSAHPDVFGQVDVRKLGSTTLILHAGNYVLRVSAVETRGLEFGEREVLERLLPVVLGDCVVRASAGEEQELESALVVKPASVNALALEASSSKSITVQPRALTPELLSSARATNCSACHVGGR